MFPYHRGQQYIHTETKKKQQRNIEVVGQKKLNIQDKQQAPPLPIGQSRPSVCTSVSVQPPPPHLMNELAQMKSSELTTSIAHLYRGEMGRQISLERERLSEQPRRLLKNDVDFGHWKLCCLFLIVIDFVWILVPIGRLRLRLV